MLSRDDRKIGQIVYVILSADYLNELKRLAYVNNHTDSIAGR